MADGIVLNSGAGGGPTVATDEIVSLGTQHVQRIKLGYGADGSYTEVNTGAGLPVNVDNTVTVTGTITADAGTNLNTSALALESGGNLATIAAAVAAEGAALGSGVLLQGDDGTDRKNINVDPTTGDVQVDVTNTVTINGTVSVDYNSGTFVVQHTNSNALDYDTGAGTVNQHLVGLALPASGGPVAGGTATNPVRTDPTGTTTQPVSGTVTANLSATDNAVLDQIQANTANLTNAIVQDDAPFTPATGYLMMIGGEFDDAAPDSVDEGDAGNVRITANRSMHMTIRDAAGNERGLNVDASGRIGVTIEADNATVVTQYTEDAVAAANPVGTTPVFVRQDTPASEVSANGDVIAGRATQYGAQYVQILDSSGNFINTFGGSGGTASTDDAAFTAGSGQGTPMMGFATSDVVDAGDVGVLAMDTSRNLKVSIEVDNVGIGGGTQYTEDDAAAANPTGNMLIAVRADSLSAVTSTNGDNIALRSTNNGELYVKHTDAIPASQSGTWNINNVSGTVSLPTGAATSANQSTANSALSAIQTAVELIDNAIAGSEMQVDVVAALPAGTNNIGDVDVASIAAGSNLIGDVGLSGARTSGGTTIFRSIDLDETEEEIKSSAGQVYWIHAMNLAATKRYLKFYNATAATVVVGTTTPVMTFPLPTQGDTNGAGFTLAIPNGIAFGTAITVAATTGIADADTGAPGANEVIVHVGYG